MSLPSTSPISDRIHALSQRFNLPQEKFAAKLGVSFEAVNRWEKGHRLASSIALQRIEDLWPSIGKPGKNLLKPFGSEGSSDV